MTATLNTARKTRTALVGIIAAAAMTVGLSATAPIASAAIAPPPSTPAPAASAGDPDNISFTVGNQSDKPIKLSMCNDNRYDLSKCLPQKTLQPGESTFSIGDAPTGIITYADGNNMAFDSTNSTLLRNPSIVFKYVGNDPYAAGIEMESSTFVQGEVQIANEGPRQMRLSRPGNTEYVNLVLEVF